MRRPSVSASPGGSGGIDGWSSSRADGERLRIALGAARAGVIDLDLARRTAWTSPEVAAIVGRRVTFEDFAVTPWAMCHAEDRPRVEALVADWDVGPHEPVEIRVPGPAGDWRWIQIHGEKLPGRDGRLARIIALVLDIDARKRQELALAHAERAALAAVEAKDRFLANMSHEIRTPMNGVLGVMHLLEREALSPDGRRRLAEATNCGRMLAQLLNDVIDFSRLEAGRLELSAEPIDPARSLSAMADLLRPEAEAKGLTLTVETEGEPGWVLADPARVSQALFNLIGNAVKFTFEGGVQARLRVRTEGDFRRVRFEVQDTGIGVPVDLQAGLFTRFHQADASAGGRFSGSGLGLAITGRLAELMGGGVGFSSSPGRGSTFWLEILAAGVVAPRPDSADALFGLRVLVVDDKPRVASQGRPAPAACEPPAKSSSHRSRPRADRAQIG